MAIVIKLVDKYDDARFKDLVKRNLEDSSSFIPAWNYYNNNEEPEDFDGEKIRIGAFEGDNLIGLSWGQALKKSRFMMHMSLVEPEYRGQGIYQKMLKVILEKTKNYDEVDSCHHILNNKIIAIKLKQGFNIVGIDQSIIIGPRVNLRFYNNQKLFELMRFRTGLTPMPKFHNREDIENES